MGRTFQEPEGKTESTRTEWKSLKKLSSRFIVHYRLTEIWCGGAAARQWIPLCVA